MVEPRAPAILIVEDEAGIARLRGQFQRAGYITRFTRTGEGALAALARWRFDLVLLDYRLPGELTGLSLLEQIKTEGHDVPIIVVTGESNEGTAIRALRAGVRDFIPKVENYLEYLPAVVERVLRQVRTERQLAESEARLAAIIDTAKDAVLVVEADRHVALFNAAAERMFGCSAAEAAGRPLTHFIPDEYVPTNPQDDDDDIFSSQFEPVSSSYTIILRAGKEGVRASGERFPLETSVSSAEVGGRRFYTLLVRDITERVQAERQLRAQATLLDKATDAILVRDLGGRIRFWNAGAERLYG
ncbi:MAG TPA: PAS domain S-box protein, partial [Gemmataceae bacterium]|nr:PAS domain S-box protein [Gemmataceae bacterium]